MVVTAQSLGDLEVQRRLVRLAGGRVGENKPPADLHRCADCAYWQPALNCFGKPTERGGCPFAPARNRKGDKLRECEIYEEDRKMTAELKPQGTKELESLVHFWKDSLSEHRLLISPSTVYLVEQTIKSLEELKQIKEAS